jgi:hypothetical protein
MAQGRNNLLKFKVRDAQLAVSTRAAQGTRLLIDNVEVVLRRTLYLHRRGGFPQHQCSTHSDLLARALFALNRFV